MSLLIVARHSPYPSGRAGQLPLDESVVVVVESSPAGGFTLPIILIRDIVLGSFRLPGPGMGIAMNGLSRRAFVGMSVGGVSALCLPPSLAAAAECVTGGLPPFMPNSLTVDCASKRNFQAFRQNPEYLGLAGVVSMTSVRGSQGSYPAGNLFLFPWLKPKGQALKGRTWPALVPINPTQVVNSSAIPNGTLPLDEYFCRYVLQAPWTSFIGFQLDKPYHKSEAGLAWFTNVDKLADGKGVGIDWTSPNLNNPWFGGSRWIPNTAACNGNAWREVIIAGLKQASVAAC
jgi:hypothetical protein